MVQYCLFVYPIRHFFLRFAGIVTSDLEKDIRDQNAIGHTTTRLFPLLSPDILQSLNPLICGICPAWLEAYIHPIHPKG